MLLRQPINKDQDKEIALRLKGAHLNVKNRLFRGANEQLIDL